MKAINGELSTLKRKTYTSEREKDRSQEETVVITEPGNCRG
jgi:hypothetical protein